MNPTSDTKAPLDPGNYAQLEIPDTSHLAGEAIAANFFNLSWSSGVEVQLDIGYLALDQLAAINTMRGQQGMPVVRPIMTHRVFMSVRGFAMLYHNVLNAANALRESGVPLDTMTVVERIERPDAS